MDRQDEKSESQFARLNDVCFPDEITALVHVLEQIDELLMLPSEALAKAVEAGNLQWLAFLLHKFGFEPLDSVASAAANGRLDAVIFLLSKASDGENNGNPDEEEDSGSDDDNDDSESDDDDTSEGEEQDDRQMQRVLKKATVRAAKNGHVAVVEFLLSKISGGHEDDVHDVMGRVLDEAAGNGHLSLVKFAVEHATQWGYVAIYSASSPSDALSRAISGGHDHVAKFLLDQSNFCWKMKKAFEQAITEERQEIVEWIYAVYSQFIDGGNLLADLIRDEQTNAVEYLLRISPQLIDQTFRTANTAVVKFLHKNYNISAESITAAFQSAARCGIVDGVNYFPSNDQQEIVNFLSKAECIPPQDMIMAFASASSNQLSGIVLCLRDDQRLPLQMVIKVFKRAINCRDLDMVIASYSDQRIPTEVVSEAIKKVANQGDIDIVEFLFDDAAIPDDVKQEAIVSAAGCNQNEVVQFMCNIGDWPLHVLKEALNVANDSKLKEYSHEKVTKA